MSPLPNVRYRITPSLLNSFQRFLDLNTEEYWVQDSNGGWHKNYNEETGEYLVIPSKVEELAEQELIDSINRVPFVSEAASKGTAFNEVVDSFLNGERSDKVQMRGDKTSDTIHTEIDGFNFDFSYRWTEEVVDYFKDSLTQVEVHAPLDTKYGKVELYGFIDYLRHNHVYDLKTTKNYTFGDHSKGWQKHVYPYALIESGMVTEVEDFEYTIYKWSGGTRMCPQLYGTQFREVYSYSHERTIGELRSVCERFIEFLEMHRAVITDLKVFGGLYHTREEEMAAEAK